MVLAEVRVCALLTLTLGLGLGLALTLLFALVVTEPFLAALLAEGGRPRLGRGWLGEATGLSARDAAALLLVRFREPLRTANISLE